MDLPSNSIQKLAFNLPRQPTLTSCGPTCLHGIYRYFGDTISLETVIDEIMELENGGTLCVFLGVHALKRGYAATLYSFNLRVFDPTWFGLGREPMLSKLSARLKITKDEKLRVAISAYAEFLKCGGELKFADLNTALLRKYLKRDLPILTGLSSTFLYRSSREIPETCADDDIRGEPCGHFVVISGYDQSSKEADIADPFEDNPLAKEQHYKVNFDRLINAILLGSYTYDANLLIVAPKHTH